MEVSKVRLHQRPIVAIIAYLFFGLVLAVNPANAAEKKVFHWVDDAGSPLLIYKGTDGKPVGIFYEIMTEAFHRLDIPLEIKLYPWARTQKIVADGNADGMVTVLTNARKQLFLGSDPVLIASERVFAYKNNPRINEIMSIRSLKEIRPFRVVETVGSGWTEENLKHTHITWVPDMDNAFNMLINGRADIFLANGFTGAGFIDRKIKKGDSFSEGYKCIINNPYPLKAIAYRLLVRKDSPFVKILDDFNETIHQMQADGTIQHILAGKQLLQRDDAYDQ